MPGLLDPKQPQQQPIQPLLGPYQSPNLLDGTRALMASIMAHKPLGSAGGRISIGDVAKQGLEFSPGIGDLMSAADAVNYAKEGRPWMAGLSGLGALPLIPAIGSIKAFHGSPRLFNKFDLSKIGTGEGAQAYGHGLYFAESPEVAKSYQEALSGGAGSLYNVDLRWPDAAREAVDPLGPQHMLDWDKPLSEQPEAVKAIAREFGVKDRVNIAERPDLGEFLMVDSIGDDLYSEMVNKLGGKQAASEYMRSLGIPGIRYLDAGSRGAGEGTSNYVIFDDDLIKILNQQ